MAMLFMPGKYNPDIWLKALRKNLDEHHQKTDIQLWPNVESPDAIEFAIVWNYPYGELKKYPQLKCISSLGAGVDHILGDPELPKNIPVTRVVDKYLTQDMTHYVVWAVLNHARHFDFYTQSQARHLWTPRALMKRPHIGIMGIGQLGHDVAVKLRDLGFDVNSWSRTPKNIQGVRHFFGEDQKKDFLKEADVLICLLPLTAETRHILNRDLFSQLPPGAYIINAARGEHLVENDLLAALENDQLSGACLDVFYKEPLPPEHPFWRNTKIKITPR